MITLIKYEDIEAVLVKNIFSQYARDTEPLAYKNQHVVNKDVIEHIKKGTLIPVQSVCAIISSAIDAHINSLIKFEDELF
jgi:hypothetical protein